MDPDTGKIEETFHTLRAVSGHTIQSLWKNYLSITISHRFGGTIDEGMKEFFGLDNGADIRIGVGYGITDDLMIGIGRSRVDKIYDGYVKYRLLHQRYNGMPVSLSVFGSVAIMTDDFNEDEAEVLQFKHRLSYHVELLLARRISRVFSVQLSPALVHHNYTRLEGEKNTTIALGVIAASHFNEKLSLTIEYLPVFNQGEIESGARYDAFGLSFNIRSSRKHEYQIQFSNSTALVGQHYILYTTDDFFNRGIHIGFHIQRSIGL